MRKYMASLAVLTFLLFALGAMAQTSGSYGQSNPPSASSSSTEGQNSSTTTSTTTSQTTTSQQQQANFEGCVVREQADYYLVPRSGSPMKLQSSAGQDFSSKVGQQVQITGNQSSLSASTGAPGASASAGTSGGMAGSTSGTAGAQTGTGATGAIGAPSSTTGTGSSGMATGSDLHSMANQQLDVSNISSVGSCPPNWNPSVPQSSGSTPSQTR